MNFRRSTIFLLIVSILTCFIPVTQADAKASDVPAIIRVGLYFDFSKLGIKTAVDSFTVSAEKGVEVGWYSGNVFNVIVDSKDNSSLNIKKDNKYYFTYTTTYNNKEQAQSKVNEIASKGVQAFIGIDSVSNWTVLVGGYTSEATALADKKSNLDTKLKGYELKIVLPSAKRVIVENKLGQAICGFYPDSASLTARPSANNSINVMNVNNKPYRGEINVIRQVESDMTVINVVALDQYLYSVVPSEIGASSHPEALKAQAVAARTYVSLPNSKYSTLGFDVCTTQYSQTYKGYSTEAASSNKAVNETSGQIVKYNGKPAQVFYFSSSGGRTEDVKNVWGSSFPYLVSVEDKYETGKTYNANWSITLTAEQIKSKVKKDIGDVTNVEVTKRSDAGRAIELIVSGTKDQAIYKLESARTVFSLPSQMYTITTDSNATIKVGVNTNSVSKKASDIKVMTASGLKDLNGNNNITILGANGVQKNVTSTSSGKYTFTGKGWGHAIGMSQSGAMGMGAAGFTYKQILEHYFKGTVVE